MSANLLAGLTESDVVEDPFPHIVVENALPIETVRQLLADWPDDSLFCGASPALSNRRFNYNARQIMSNASIAPSWQSFTVEHSSAEFFRRFVQIFGRWIRAEYPQLIDRFGADLEGMRTGLRNVDNLQQRDLLIDVQLAINTPVTRRPTSVRSAHVDRPNKLFAGLYYLRPEFDRESRGGDLELCRLRAGARPRFTGLEMVDERCTDVQRLVPYRQNVLVLFLNTLRSIHGVTPRFRTPYSRRFVNIVGEVPDPLFSVTGLQASRLLYVAHHYRRQLLAWRSTR